MLWPSSSSIALLQTGTCKMNSKQSCTLISKHSFPQSSKVLLGEKGVEANLCEKILELFNPQPRQPRFLANPVSPDPASPGFSSTPVTPTPATPVLRQPRQPRPRQPRVSASPVNPEPGNPGFSTPKPNPTKDQTRRKSGGNCRACAVAYSQLF